MKTKTGDHCGAHVTNVQLRNRYSDVRLWSGAGTTVIEIDAPLLTVKLLM